MDITALNDARARLRAQLRAPFYTNAANLIGVQVAVSALGFLFWAVITRVLPVETVGVGSGLVSAAMLITGLSQLGVEDGLIYFLPRAKAPERFIRAGYTITGLAALAGCAVFLVGHREWSAGLFPEEPDSARLVIFVLCTLALQVSSTQDAVFIAGRVSKYVMVKGIFTNLLRILVFFLVLPLGGASLLLSAGAAGLIGSLLFEQVYQKKEKPGASPGLEFSPAIWKPMLSVSLGNYIMGSLTNLPNTILPLLILARLGAASNAFFNVAWLFPNMISVFGRAFGVSLYVESGRDGASANNNLNRAVCAALGFTLPAAGLMALFAPQLLRLFGEAYSTESAALVRTLALSNIPLAVYGILIGVLKSHRLIGRLIGLGAVYAGTHIILSLLFLNLYQLPGVGWAFCLARTICLAAALLCVIQHLSARVQGKQRRLPPG